MANPYLCRKMQSLSNSKKRLGLEEYSRPAQSFRAHYRLANEKKLEVLWRYYLHWRENKIKDDYSQFDYYIKSCSLKAKQDVEAMPHPLKNGKKGEEYHCSFQMPESVNWYIINGLDEIGLTYTRDIENNSKVCTICGIPNEAGEYSVQIVYAGYGGILEMHERKLTLQIMPDPKELWRDVPTVESIEYFKKDIAGEILQANDYVMLAASRRGRSHAHAGLPRDDDFALHFNAPTSWYILAVADGAGSAEFSRRGSQIACGVAIDTCRKKLESFVELDDFFDKVSAESLKDPEKLADARKLVYSILPQAAFEAHKAIRAEASEKNRETRQYSTTLLMVMAKKYPDGWVVLSFQIGDGAMALLQYKEGAFSLRLLAEPDEGEYGGQTRFITMNEIFEPNELMRRLRVDIVPDLEALLLMTDGISDAYFATLSNLHDLKHWQNFWLELQPAINSPDPVWSMLEWLNFWSQGNHDDRTIAMLYPSSINK